MRQVTPHVAIDPATLGAEFGFNLANTAYGLYLNAGLPVATAAALANVYAAVGGQFAAGFAAGIPSLGLVQADQSPNDIHRLYWSHYNFGEINYWGADIATNYEINSAASLYANYSFINQTEFTKEDIGDETSSDVYHLNIPKHRVKAGFAYNPILIIAGSASLFWFDGKIFGLSFRYQNSKTRINTLNVLGKRYQTFLFWFDALFTLTHNVWDMNADKTFGYKINIADNILGKKFQSSIKKVVSRFVYLDDRSTSIVYINS